MDKIINTVELKKIKNVRFENFRCFKELEINDLGDVNIIVGKNNTGKSTFLEGLTLGLYNKTFFLNERIESLFFSSNLIKFLFERRNLHLPKYPLRPNLKHQIVIIKNPEEEEDLLDSIQKFFKYEQILNTKLILNREHIVNIIEKQQEVLSNEKLLKDIFQVLFKFRPVRFLGYEHSKYKHLKEKLEKILLKFINIKKALEIENLVTIYFFYLEDIKSFFEEVKHYASNYKLYLEDIFPFDILRLRRLKTFPFVSFLFFHLNTKEDKMDQKINNYVFYVDRFIELNNQFFKKLENYVDSELYETLKEKISIFFDKNVKSFTPMPYNIYLYFENGEKIPIALIGDGTKSLIRDLYALYLDRPSYILFEEPENFKHPKMLNIFAEEVVKAGRKHQIFINTHSDELVRYILAHAYDFEDIDIKVIAFRELKEGILDYTIIPKEKANTLVFSLGEDLR